MLCTAEDVLRVESSILSIIYVLSNAKKETWKLFQGHANARQKMRLPSFQIFIANTWKCKICHNTLSRSRFADTSKDLKILAVPFRFADTCLHMGRDFIKISSSNNWRMKRLPGLSLRIADLRQDFFLYIYCTSLTWHCNIALSDVDTTACPWLLKCIAVLKYNRIACTPISLWWFFSKGMDVLMLRCFSRPTACIAYQSHTHKKWDPCFDGSVIKFQWFELAIFSFSVWFVPAEGWMSSLLTLFESKDNISDTLLCAIRTWISVLPLNLRPFFGFHHWIFNPSDSEGLRFCKSLLSGHIDARTQWSGALLLHRTDAISAMAEKDAVNAEILKIWIFISSAELFHCRRWLVFLADVTCGTDAHSAMIVVAILYIPVVFILLPIYTYSKMVRIEISASFVSAVTAHLTNKRKDSKLCCLFVSWTLPGFQLLFVPRFCIFFLALPPQKMLRVTHKFLLHVWPSFMIEALNLA